MGQPKLSGGTPDTSWSVLQNHHLGNDLPDLHKITTNLKYITLGRWGAENIFWASDHDHISLMMTIIRMMMMVMMMISRMIIRMMRMVMMMINRMMRVITCKRPPSPHCRRSASRTRPSSPWTHRRARRPHAYWVISNVIIVKFWCYNLL